MGSHLWALSSPTFISLPATSLGRANLRHFTFTPWLSSPASVSAQPSHAPGIGSSEEPLLLYRNQAGMATASFSSSQKTGDPWISSLREQESTWECEDSNMGSPENSSCAPGEPHQPLQNLSPSEHPLLSGVQPSSRRSCGDHQAFPETPMPAWHLSRPLPSFEEYKTPPRAGVGLAGGGQAGVGTVGLLLHPGARARIHPAPSRLPSLCSRKD